jgi:glycerol dehydrogenase
MKAHERRGRRAGVAGPVEPLWIWGDHAIENAASELLKLPQPMLLVGEAKLLRPLSKRLKQAWIEAGVELVVADFSETAECCASELESVLAVLKSKKAASLVGFGGGKCLDLVKWAGFQSGLPVAMVPSSAATCACASGVVVVHDRQGAVLDLVDLARPPELCVVDFEILKSAPRRLLAAGVADTLAKWLEWSVLEENPQGSEPAQEAFELLKRGPDASLDNEEAVLHACLRLSSEASNAGQAPAAAAHSFCAGISVLPRSNTLLHGEWAGLGLLFQDWLLKRHKMEMPDPRPWLELWGLPLSLPFKLASAERAQVAARMLDPQESIHAIIFPAPLSLELLEEGLRSLEA